MFKFSSSDSTVRPVHERTLAANLFATVDSPQCPRGGSIFIAGHFFLLIVSVLCCADSPHINFHRRFEHTLCIFINNFADILSSGEQILCKSELFCSGGKCGSPKTPNASSKQQKPTPKQQKQLSPKNSRNLPEIEDEFMA